MIIKPSNEVSENEAKVSNFEGVKFVTLVQVFMKVGLGGGVPGWPHERVESSGGAQNGQNRAK